LNLLGRLFVGVFLIVWSGGVFFAGHFWYGVEWKGGIRITPDSHPAGYWTMICTTALLGIGIIIASMLSFVRASRAKQDMNRAVFSDTVQQSRFTEPRVDVAAPNRTPPLRGQ
jgi:hypothetical protein